MAAYTTLPIVGPKDLLDLAELEREHDELLRELEEFNKTEVKPILQKQAELKKRILTHRQKIDAAFNGVVRARRRPLPDIGAMADNFDFTKAKLPAQIIAVLAANPEQSWTKDDLLKAGVTASSPSVLSAALSRLAKDERIDKDGRGRYRAKQ